MPNVRPDALEVLYVDGLELPLCDIGHIDPPPRTLTLAGVEYVFTRSFPLKGYSAVLGKAAQAMMAEGKELLIGRWGTRLYVYTAPAVKASA